MPAPIGKSAERNQVEHAIGRDAQVLHIFSLRQPNLLQPSNHRAQFLRKGSQSVARRFFRRFHTPFFFAGQSNAPVVSRADQILDRAINRSGCTQIHPAQWAAVAEQECSIALVRCAPASLCIGDELDKQFLRLEASADVFASGGTDGRSELRDFAAQAGFERINALLQNRNSLERLPAQSVRPFCSQVVEQALVAALQVRARKRARPHHRCLQFAITERNGQRGLTLQHGLPLVEAVADAAVRILPQALTPVVHLVENPSLAAGDSFKGQGASCG